MKPVRIVVVLSALATFACGGATFTSEPGDAAPDTRGPDASPPEDAAPAPDASPVDGGGKPDARPPYDSGPRSPNCPPAAPAIGSPCSDADLQCEYGDAWWNVSCDVVVQCQGGAWASFQPSFYPCSPAPPAQNPAACPATYVDVPQGAECSATGTSCYYTQAECECEVPLGGPIQLDAGMRGYWGCVPQPGCPFPRALIGTACTSEGQSCTYQECGYAQTCMDGTWQGTPEACAGASP